MITILYLENHRIIYYLDLKPNKIRYIYIYINIKHTSLVIEDVGLIISGLITSVLTVIIDSCLIISGITESGIIITSEVISSDIILSVVLIIGDNGSCI